MLRTQTTFHVKNDGLELSKRAGKALSACQACACNNTLTGLKVNSGSLTNQTLDLNRRILTLETSCRGWATGWPDRALNQPPLKGKGIPVRLFFSMFVLLSVALAQPSSRTISAPEVGANLPAQAVRPRWVCSQFPGNCEQTPQCEQTPLATRGQPAPTPQRHVWLFRQRS